jgi:outer membrane protein assembly factor BamB
MNKQTGSSSRSRSGVVDFMETRSVGEATPCALASLLGRAFPAIVGSATAVLIAAFAAWGTYRVDAATPPEGLALSGGWPVYRGDAAGTGVSATTLPDRPEVLWTFKAEDSIFLSSAVIADGKVFVGDGDGSFYALDLATGRKLWSAPSDIGFTAAAAVRDGRVYAGDSDGIFYCWDAKTGKLVWQHQTEAEINSSPNFFQDSVIVGSQDGSLYRFRCTDGKVLWKYTIEASGGIQCSPTLAENRAFVCGCDGQLHIIDVDQGKSIATLSIGDPTLATAAIAGDQVYFGTEGARFFGINWRKPEIVWTYQHPKRRLAYRSSAAVGDSAVVVGGRNKAVEALDPKSGKLIWSFQSRGRVDSSPVVVGRRVYVGSTDGRLYGLDLRTGKETWQYDAGGSFSASPAVAAGRMVIGNEDGVLYCFGERK